MSRAFLQLTRAQLLLFIRNRQMIFWSLFFPILLIVVIGSLMGDSTGISLSGAVIDQDRSDASRTINSEFSQQKIIAFTPGTSLDQALTDLKNGDLQLVVVIPRGYGSALSSASTLSSAPPSPSAPAQITVYYDQSNAALSQMGLTVVNQIVDQFSKSLTGYTPAITVKSEAVQSLNLTYIDFIIPGIVAMMIMSNNLNGVAGQIAAWRERGILRRMQSTTLRPSIFIAAQIAARLLLNGLQAMLVLIIGSLFFDAEVNGSWWLLLLFVLLGTLAFMAIGFIIAGVAKNPESAGPIAGVISFPLLFLGGVFFPIKSMPEFLQPFVELLPIAHLTTALRQVMNVGADLASLWLEALLLTCWLVVSFVIASFTFKWE